MSDENRLEHELHDATEAIICTQSCLSGRQSNKSRPGAAVLENHNGQIKKIPHVKDGAHKGNFQR
jgi:hypothetical protein